MKRNIVIWVVALSLIFGALGGWVFNRYIIPKLNTIDWLVRNNLAPSPGPLVINTRQEIRVNEGSDSIATIQTAKPWLVGIFSGSDQYSAKVAATGLILTSDGLIATTRQAVPTDLANLQVALQDGNVLPAQVVARDTASDLVLIKISAANLPAAALGFPKDLQLGQRIIVLSASLGQYQATNVVSFLASEMRNIRYDQVYSSERISRTFIVDGLANVTEGSVAISLDGNAQGIHSDSGILGVDIIRGALNSYFARGTVTRNYIGVYYQNISRAASNQFQIPEGVIFRRPDARTPAVIAQSPAQLAGLLEGDIVSKVDDTQINFDNTFEELIGKKQPGENIKLTVRRGADTKEITVTIGSKP